MPPNYKMTKLQRSPSGAYFARKGIPQDVRDRYHSLYGKRWEEWFSAPPDTIPPQAKASHASWLSEIEGRIATLRSTADPLAPRKLTPIEIQVLSGEWYRWYVSQREHDPGPLSELTARREEIFGLDEIFFPGDDDFEGGRQQVLEGFAKLTEADQFLITKGLVLAPMSLETFLVSLLPHYEQAIDILTLRSKGNWSKDKYLETLPDPSVLPSGTTKPANGARRSRKQPGPLDLWEHYKQDKKPAKSTVNRWDVVFKTLDPIINSPSFDPQQWLDSLKTNDRSARTVKDIWLSSARTVYRWAVRKKLITTNPFTDCYVEVPKRVVTRETGRGFNNQEVSLILSASLSTPPFKIGRDRGANWFACKRWVPWLAAYTGARGGELTQLRACDIELRPCGPVVRITPDAGTVKTKRVRVVPIHEHLITQGFLAFVEAVRSAGKPDSPLFHLPAENIKEGYRGPAVKARERLAGWIREIGVTDEGLSPLHAFRHTFKRRAMKAGIEPHIRDAICGHNAKDVARDYEQVDVEQMAEAMKLFPRYEVG